MNTPEQLAMEQRLQDLLERLETLERAVQTQAQKIEHLKAERDPKALLGPREVAERLGVSRRTVTNMVGDGVLPMFKVGGQLRIHPDTLERVIRHLAGQSR